MAALALAHEEVTASVLLRHSQRDGISMPGNEHWAAASSQASGSEGAVTTYLASK